MNKYLPLFLLICILACKNKEEQYDPLERNLVLAGKNRPELEKVISHFQRNPNDSLKLKSAIFLLNNIEEYQHYEGKWRNQYDRIFEMTASLDNTGFQRLKDSIESEIGSDIKSQSKLKKDLTTLKGDYLIKNIDQAYESWQQSPWANTVHFETFCNYILPYKSFNEYPEEWRSSLYNRYKNLLLDPDLPNNMDDVCCALVKDEMRWFKYSEAYFNYPGAISISAILKGQRGDCREMTSLATYSARAMGIPVAIDYTPQWANHSSGHIWNSLIINDTLSWPFIGAECIPGDYSSVARGETKIAKAYRFTLAINESSLAARARKEGIISIPQTLKTPRILDVTDQYVATADLRMDINAPDGTPVYLCIFKGKDWQVMDGSLVEGNKAHFKQMGRDILYMPMYYKSEKLKPAGPPFILPFEGDISTLKTNDLQFQDIKIFRKYPLRRYRAMWNLAQYLINSRFEGSNSPDFTNATLFYLAPEPMSWYYINQVNGRVFRDTIRYENLWEEANIQITDSFRYVRMITAKKNPVKLGELEFYSGESEMPIRGIPVGNLPHPERAFDGVPGYSIIKEDELEKDRWIGLDLGEKKSISKIRYIPSNDKNEIIPKRRYELFYWKDKWISVGSQLASAQFLEYKNVPAETMYWLHCMDCVSMEERPFTFKEGIQVWW